MTDVFLYENYGFVYMCDIYVNDVRVKRYIDSDGVYLDVNLQAEQYTLSVNNTSRTGKWNDDVAFFIAYRAFKCGEVKKMSNKSEGAKFEREVAKLFHDQYGMWSHCLVNDKNGQPFDIVAVGKYTYCIDCKVCRGGYFSFDRVEENQRNAFEELKNTNALTGFALKFEDEIYFLPYALLKCLETDRVRRVNKEFLASNKLQLEKYVKR